MEFNFGKRNYQMMIAGVVIILIGYILMSGGKSENPDIFSEDIFSTRRLTVAPLLIISGLVLEVFAILHKAKDE